MKKVEATGKTVEEAIQNALLDLGVTRDDAEIEILEEPDKKILGLFGGKPARVSAIKKQSPEAAAREEKVKKELEMEHQAAQMAPEIAREGAAMEHKVAVVEDEAMARVTTFLTDIANMLGAPANLDINPEEEAVRITLTGDDMGRLIGHRGETLDALQYLSGQIYNKGRHDEYQRLIVDSENYRNKRIATLESLAMRMADKAVETGRRVEMEPMNPYERRIIHSSLQTDGRVVTHSEGEEPRRYLVITPK